MKIRTTICSWNNNNKNKTTFKFKRQGLFVFWRIKNYNWEQNDNYLKTRSACAGDTDSENGSMKHG